MKSNLLNKRVLVIGFIIIGILCVVMTAIMVTGKVIGKRSIRLWASQIYGVDIAEIVVIDKGVEFQKSWGFSFRLINRYECRHEGKGIPLQMIWAYYPWGKMYGLNFSTGSG